MQSKLYLLLLSVNMLFSICTIKIILFENLRFNPQNKIVLPLENYKVWEIENITSIHKICKGFCSVITVTDTLLISLSSFSSLASFEYCGSQLFQQTCGNEIGEQIFNSKHKQINVGRMLGLCGQHFPIKLHGIISNIVKSWDPNVQKFKTALWVHFYLF